MFTVNPSNGNISMLGTRYTMSDNHDRGSQYSARYGGGGNGTATSALIYGGYTAPAPRQALTELWNGTNWTEVNDLNNGVLGKRGSGTGNTAALSIGGYITAAVAQTEEWNGVSWAVTSSLNSAINGAGAGGTTTSAFNTGGAPAVTATEEWNVPSNVVKTLTD